MLRRCYLHVLRENKQLSQNMVSVSRIVAKKRNENFMKQVTVSVLVDKDVPHAGGVTSCLYFKPDYSHSSPK